MKTLRTLPAIALTIALSLPLAFGGAVDDAVDNLSGNPLTKKKAALAPDAADANAAKPDYSLDYYSAGAVDEAIDDLVNMAEAPNTNAAEANDEICSRIEENLPQLQGMGPDLDEKAFKKADKALKAMYTDICEHKRYDASKLAQAEIQLDQLEMSLSHADMLVKKKKGKRYGKKKYKKSRKGKKKKSRRARAKEREDDDVVSEGVEDSSGGPRVMTMFPGVHNQCAPGCGYVSWGIWGDARHRAKRSCHNAGDAIDVHAIRCGGTVSPGGSPKFRAYVDCVLDHGMGVIFNRPDIGKPNRQHTNHAHFELPNCRFIRGR
jgi:hypothetical protein